MQNQAKFKRHIEVSFLPQGESIEIEERNGPEVLATMKAEYNRDNCILMVHSNSTGRLNYAKSSCFDIVVSHVLVFGCLDGSLVEGTRYEILHLGM